MRQEEIDDLRGARLDNDYHRMFNRLGELTAAYLNSFYGGGISPMVDLFLGFSHLELCERFFERYSGARNDEKALLFVLISHFQRVGASPWHTPKDMLSSLRPSIDNALGRLITRGDVVLAAENENLDDRSLLGHPVMLSPEACRFLFGGLEKYVNLAPCLNQAGRLIRAEEINKKDLYYAKDTQVEVNRLFEALSVERFDKVMARLKGNGRKQAISSMLYGPPGTGKTELAMQLARATDRNIISTDVAKLTGSYVGESEKNYRNLFSAYRYALAIMQKAPILLMNEADAVISKRLQVSRAIEKYENNVQDILLDELDTFEGILIATTNNMSNIDDAFDRRFLLKIGINRPDTNARRRIWQGTVPDMTESQLDILSDGFALSGAEIGNIATRVDIIATLEDRDPTLSDYLELAREAGNNVIGKDSR